MIVEQYHLHQWAHENEESVTQFVAALKKLSEHYQIGQELSSALQD